MVKGNKTPWHKHRELVVGILLGCGGGIMAIGLALLPATNPKAVLFWLVILFFLLGFSASLLVHYFWRRTLAILVGVLVSGVLTCGFGWYVLTKSPPRVNTPDRPPIAVYDGFRDIHDHHKELGDPKDKEHSSSNVGQVSYQNAWAIYFYQPLSGWFVLFRDKMTWEYKSDTAPKHDHDNFRDYAWRRQYDWMGDGSHPPKPKGYPMGGIAKLWSEATSDQEKKFWRDMGWWEWDCGHDSTEDVYYQEFDNGYIVGPCRTLPEYDPAMVFVLFGKENGKWTHRGEGVAPKCTTIARPETEPE